ncbi:RES family NAD+ phosphorylase [Pseudarthrobacter scleromae]|uniref:RES family NAD+ phosphorylase n=1 Tax=Pseudarthrobacter scleromae TaxID=158897 RepID=UPI00362B5571
MRRVPGRPFEPEEYVLETNTILFRVFSTGGMVPRTVTDFNPGKGDRTRFAFFGDPTVPVLYAAESEEAAVCESILHDVPSGPGAVLYESFADRVCAPLAPTRDLSLVSLMGDGLFKLGTQARYVTGTMASQYTRTVRWAEAVHEAGFDGLVWMSNRRNTDRAFVFFGDRVEAGDLVALPGTGRIFAAGAGFDWLADYLTSLKIEILIP